MDLALVIAQDDGEVRYWGGRIQFPELRGLAVGWAVRRREFVTAAPFLPPTGKVVAEIPGQILR